MTYLTVYCASSAIWTVAYVAYIHQKDPRPRIRLMLFLIALMPALNTLSLLCPITYVCLWLLKRPMASLARGIELVESKLYNLLKKS